MGFSRAMVALLFVAFASVVGSFGPEGRAALRAPDAPPLHGVVLVVLDAARAQSVGAFGGKPGVTPHLDALARESIVFDQAFTPAVYTRAAMAALWTSREPGERGLRRAPRLAEVLSAHGVTTAGFVANPNAGRSFGHDRGFSAFAEEDGVPPPPSDGLVDQLEEFLGRVGRAPFFAYLHVREPHFPYLPPPPFAERLGENRVLPDEAFRDPDWVASLNRRGGPTPAEAAELERAYEANLAYADHLVGRVLARLRQTGLLARVAVIVTADHGESLGEHGHVGHNDQVYAESARVPLLLSLPGGPAERLGRLASLLDVAPTVTQLLGVPARGFEGISLLDREGPADRTLSCRGADAEAALAVRDGRYTLVTTRRGVGLFDRQRDPGETSDLSTSRPAQLAALRARAERLSTDEPSLDEAPRLEAASRDALRALGYLQ